MKKSELRQMIREEYKRSLKEAYNPPTIVKSGKSYVGKDGGKFMVKDIHIGNFHTSDPTTYVTYDWEAPDGKKGKGEVVTLKNFRNNVLNQ